MTQRELLVAGIKLLGLCLLALGIIHAGEQALLAGKSHRALQQSGH